MLIALTGAAGSGKSTAAEYLIERHGFIRVKFAGPLKNMMRAIGFTEAHIEGDLKEAPCELLGGKTPRQAMQYLGTEFGRVCIDPDFWVRLWSAEASRHLAKRARVVVDDCRFENEARAIRELGGVVVEIRAAFTDYATTASDHVSEAGVGADCKIWNDGPLSIFHARLDGFVERIAPFQACAECERFPLT